MSWLRTFATVTLLGAFLVAGALAGDVSLQLSGPGVVDQSTIKAGEKVSLDLHFSNDKVRRGVSVGFKITSEDIAEIVHVADSGNGLNDHGDIKGFNGWADKSVFDFTGIIVAPHSWDGALPDTIGFAGIVIKKRWQPQESQHQLSLDIIVPEPGTITVDSTFFPPGGDWMYDNEELPDWGGPYTIKVVK